MAVSTIGASGLNSAVSQIGKNLIHNGAMTVSQRGASATALTGNSLSQLDRWRFWENSAAEYTTAQSTTVPSGEAFATSIEIAVTTADTSIAAGDFNILEYRFEGRDVQHLAYNTASAKTLTASFWIRSTKTGVMGCYMYQVDGNRSYVREITINTTNTWEFKTVTFPGDTAGGTAWANDSTVGGAFGICLDGGSTYQVAADAWAANQDFTTSNQMNGSDNTSNKVYVTGVQLEVGSVATDFEHEPFSVTLAKCQRYFQRFSDLDAGMAFANGHAITTTRTRAAIMLPVRLRDETYGGFTFAFSDISHISVRQTNAAYAASSITTYASAAGQIVYVDLTVATMPNAGMAVNYESDTNNAYFEVSAEL